MSKISDSNNQIFFMVHYILYVLKIKIGRIVSGQIQRLKDKKTAITDRIKDTLVNITVDTVNTQYFNSKNFRVKYNLIDMCMKSILKDEEVIKCIGKCTEDRSGFVRITKYSIGENNIN